MTSNIYITIFRPLAIASIIMSCLVILTVFLFPKMVRGRIFMQIVVLISVADLGGNWSYALDYIPANRTAICSLAGFSNLYFFPVSWLLTTFFTILLRDLAIKKVISLSRQFVIGVSFGVPLVFTLLILTTNYYGRYDDDYNPSMTCAFAGNTNDGYWWHLSTYLGLNVACFVVMLVCLVQLHVFEYNNKEATSQKSYRLAKRTLILYPCALILCWSPHIISYVIAIFYYNYTTMMFYFYATIPKIIHGGLVAVIFFAMSPESRRNWSQLCCSQLCCSLTRQTPTPESLIQSSMYADGDGEFSLPTDQALLQSLADESAASSASVTHKSVDSVDSSAAKYRLGLMKSVDTIRSSFGINAEELEDNSL